MPLPHFAAWMLEQEARALLARLLRVKPFAMQETMLPAAGLLPAAQVAIEEFLMAGRRDLRGLVQSFLVWLRSPEAAAGTAEDAQRKFTMLRLRFNAVLTQFDVFESVMTQRSEHETGVWLSGLDVVSADALRLKGNFYKAPAVICYLDRGVGAAIRRARTRLPGGGANPVSIVKIPRERMVGTGIASSLIHEVGHQAAALLDLVVSIRPTLQGFAKGSGEDAKAWRLWDRWISEILADLWSVARVGVASSMGLMAVVSLPRAFVFRLNEDDPHPVPWVRVKLSIALGRSLHPQPCWDRLEQLWDSFYPVEGLETGLRELLSVLQRTIPALVTLLVNHRPRALRGHSIRDALDLGEIEPGYLRKVFKTWRTAPHEMYEVRPLVAFAALGQARVEGTLTPEEESVVLGKLLTHWALQSTLDAAAGCASGRRAPRCSCSMAARRSKRILETTILERTTRRL